MKISSKNLRVLERLLNGNILPASSAKTTLVNELVEEKILLVKGKHKKTIELPNKSEIITYFANQYQIPNLPHYIQAANSQLNRSDYVKLTTDSKDSKLRVFKGFLVNSLHPIQAKLNGKPISINPDDGSFVFIYDFESFLIDTDIIVVGIENSLNFRHLKKQTYLFKGMKPLFIARYPQNQSKDFIRWLKLIPNKYLHFGDFDLAGIGIYFNEYKKHLGERAEFFIPKTIENDLKESGNRKRYDVQKQNFDINEIEDKTLLKLISIIHKYKKGLDQEFYIKN